MQTVIDYAVGAGVEILTLVVLALASVVGVKIKKMVDKVREKDTLGIIDLITDRAVEYANAELKGAKGKEKRDFALSYAQKILAQYKINVTEEQLLADIENGYNKFKSHQDVQYIDVKEFSIDGLSEPTEK